MSAITSVAAPTDRRTEGGVVPSDRQRGGSPERSRRERRAGAPGTRRRQDRRGGPGERWQGVRRQLHRAVGPWDAGIASRRDEVLGQTHRARKGPRPADARITTIGG